MQASLTQHNFADYFKQYVELIDDDENIIDALTNTHTKTNEVLDLIVEEKGDYSYAQGKWTIKELLVHIIDTERIFCNRALRFARNDNTNLPGFDQDDYALNSFANERSLCDIAKEFDAVRMATIALFESFNSEMLAKAGTANNNNLTVLAIGYIIAGHEKHHLNVMIERYLD